MTSIYLNEANALLGRIAPSSRGREPVAGLIRAADRQAGEALAPVANVRRNAPRVPDPGLEPLKPRRG
jgi:hypothetical protein